MTSHYNAQYLLEPNNANNNVQTLQYLSTLARKFKSNTFTAWTNAECDHEITTIRTQPIWICLNIINIFMLRHLICVCNTTLLNNNTCIRNINKSYKQCTLGFYFCFFIIILIYATHVVNANIVFNKHNIEYSTYQKINLTL